MKGISQMGLHGMGWVAQPWFSVSWRGREPSSYSTYKAGCLRSSSLVLKTWRISRESLASRPHWKMEGAGVWRQWRTERVSIHGGSSDRHTHTFSQELRDRQLFLPRPPVGRCRLLWGWIPSTSQSLLSWDIPQTHPEVCLPRDSRSYRVDS